MKKIICLWLVLTSFCLSGCSYFDRPANVEVIGVGIVQYNLGRFFVEIDSTEYTPNLIYNDVDEHYFKSCMHPVEGMIVTAFTMHNTLKINFITGKRDKAYLDEYFFENHTGDVVAAAVCIIACVGFIFLVLPTFKNHKKQKTKKKG